jgi:hypothetical protein
MESISPKINFRIDVLSTERVLNAFLELYHFLWTLQFRLDISVYL